jgi:hypothetical protein
MKLVRFSLMILLGVWLMATAVADEPETPERPLSPYMCEDWQEHVAALQESADLLEQQLGEFHAQDDMQFCQLQSVRVSEDRASEWDFSMPQMGALAWMLRALAIAGLIGLVIWLAWRWHQHFDRQRSLTDPRRPPPGTRTRRIEHYCALPEDIPAAALEAWQAGRPRDAMSLLYRGAVVRLLPEKRINEARTEREIIAALKQASTNRDTLAWMQALVNTWLGTAWANRPPDEPAFLELHRQWSLHCPVRPGASG